ncbi:MAG: response regulator transcription factor [Ardenticatenaceae bacterium]|nr:response regulator transcription factor [Ardenticatenaceae bacterium]HBY97605.1 DNA-binding response regulator [Chloroflexota bacterium]
MLHHRILVVDDEPLITDSLTYSLKREGFEVRVTHDGLSALRMAQSEPIDLILLDLMLPKLDGREVCRRLRESGITIPIIMLTARDSEMDRVTGLEIGADDYVVKPFSFAELLARVRATFRRLAYDQSQQRRVTIGDLTVEPEQMRVLRRTEQLALTRKEYELLEQLMLHAGKVLPRQELLDAVWGAEWVGDPRTLDVHIRRLRQKVEDDPDHPRYIQTVRGVGYRFSAPPPTA